jgi:hypothetical protein
MDLTELIKIIYEPYQGRFKRIERLAIGLNSKKAKPKFAITIVVSIKE